MNGTFLRMKKTEDTSSNGGDSTGKVASQPPYSVANIISQARSLFSDWKEDMSTQVFVPIPFTLPAFHDKTAVLLFKENASPLALPEFTPKDARSYTFGLRKQLILSWAENLCPFVLGPLSTDLTSKPLTLSEGNKVCSNPLKKKSGALQLEGELVGGLFPFDVVEKDPDHQWSCTSLSFKAWIFSLRDWESGLQSLGLGQESLP